MTMTKSARNPEKYAFAMSIVERSAWTQVSLIIYCYPLSDLFYFLVQFETGFKLSELVWLARVHMGLKHEEFVSLWLRRKSFKLK